MALTQGLRHSGWVRWTAPRNGSRHPGIAGSAPRNRDTHGALRWLLI